MKAIRGQSTTHVARPNELGKLRARLAEAEETLRAIRSGEVDSVMVTGKEGSQVFTLEGAEHAYRMLIESMNEGALTLTADKTILYANACFARMVKCPLEQVIGGSFRRFLSAKDRATLRPLLKRTVKSGAKIQVLLTAGDGSRIPVQLSLRSLDRPGSRTAATGMVVTDMTEARQTEAKLRALANRVVQVQEAERGRVALELHENITQLLCAIGFSSQTLVGKIPARDGSAKQEAMNLLAMVGQIAGEVERISRNLRPSVLDQLGLVAALDATSTEFTKRTGVPVELRCVELTARLPAAAELALYRILQEALRNVEEHARARRVAVHLTEEEGDIVQLTLKDDGVGFGPARRRDGRKGNAGLGLLSMRERAVAVGGDLQIKSVRRAGTEIIVRIPRSADADTAS